MKIKSLASIPAAMAIAIGAMETGMLQPGTAQTADTFYTESYGDLQRSLEQQILQTMIDIEEVEISIAKAQLEALRLSNDLKELLIPGMNDIGKQVIQTFTEVFADLRAQQIRDLTKQRQELERQLRDLTKQRQELERQLLRQP